MATSRSVAAAPKPVLGRYRCGALHNGSVGQVPTAVGAQKANGCGGGGGGGGGGGVIGGGGGRW